MSLLVKRFPATPCAYEGTGTEHLVQGREGVVLSTKLSITPTDTGTQPLSGLPLLPASRIEVCIGGHPGSVGTQALRQDLITNSQV